MKTCTLEGAIALLEDGLRCTQPLDLSALPLAPLVVLAAICGAAALAAMAGRMI